METEKLLFTRLDFVPDGAAKLSPNSRGRGRIRMKVRKGRKALDCSVPLAYRPSVTPPHANSPRCSTRPAKVRNTARLLIHALKRCCPAAIAAWPCANTASLMLLLARCRGQKVCQKLSCGHGILIHFHKFCPQA